jgi:SMI1-KNR4 cell-wall
MSLAYLKNAVPPPPKPFEVGTIKQWRKIEEGLGLKLPRDYREFVFAYGSGLFAGLYRVYNPFAKSRYTALLSQAKQVCDINRASQRSNPKRFPYPYYPDPGGLLPWGNDENGNDYFWLTEGPPTKWVVVQDNNRGEGIRVQPLSMTGFLAGILQRRIKPLASGYPRKSVFRFEPWDSGAQA